MKKIFNLHRTVAFLVAFFFSVNSFAVSLWMPATIFISPTGAISHTFPFPTSSDPGAAFGSTSVGVAGFFPVPTASVTKFKRIYAQESKAAPGDLVEKDGIFMPATNPAGYRVIDKQDVSVGLSLNAVVGLVTGWAGLGFAGGVSASKGKGFLVNKWAPTYEEASRVTLKVDLPTTLEMVKNNWKPGDSITTSRSMNLGVNGGLGVMGGALAAVGIAVGVSASWNVGVEIESPSEVKVIYARDRSKNFSVNAGNIAGGFNITKAWGKNESFEYKFDLANTAVSNLTVESYLKGKVKVSHTFTNVNITQAYQEALNGNLIFADMLASEKGKGVTRISESVKKSTSLSAGGSATLPFLFTASFNIGKSFTGGRTKTFGDNMLLEELIGVYTKQSGTEGIISNDMKRISTFAGNFQQVSPLTELDGKIQRRYSGSYKYYFVQNNVSSEKFEEELKRLRYKIGFMKELKGVPVPKGNIGTLEIDLDVTISNVATDELLKLVNQYPEEVFVKEAQDYVDGFFKGVKDAKEEICESYKVRLLKECIFTTKRQSASAMKTAYQALKKMSQLRADMDFKNFVKAYADFGKGFIENRFTMKTFLRMLRSEFNPGVEGEGKFGADKMVTWEGKTTKVPYEIILSIKGTNLAPYKQKLYTYQ